MTYQQDHAYNNLPVLPPPFDLETKTVLKKVNKANKALGELKGWSPHQSNPYLLLQTIILQEAKASSEIENIVTTNDELYQAYSISDIKNISPATKEVLHYQEALLKGYKMLKDRPLGNGIFLELFHIIKQRTDGIRSNPGTKLMNSSHETVYTPPDNQEDIYRLLKNLEEYINTPKDDLDPLIRLSLIHYQFECIHPFPDGNGRTGRIVNVLYLVQEHLLNYPTLYLSRYIIQHKTEYYNALQGVTEHQDWENWILYILTAIEETALHTLQMLKDISAAQKYMEDEMREKVPNICSKDLVELLFEYPYCKISFLVQRNIAKTQTASKYLHALYEIGILDRVKIGREIYYINKSLFRLLAQ